MAKFEKGQSGNPNGRPRKADNHAGAIARAEQQIADKLPHLVSKMLELADGVFVESANADGVRIIYQRPPDRAAIEYLVNRIMGKPKERVEVDTQPVDWSRVTDEDLHAYREGKLSLDDVRRRYAGT